MSIRISKKIIRQEKHFLRNKHNLMRYPTTRVGKMAPIRSRSYPFIFIISFLLCAILIYEYFF